MPTPVAGVPGTGVPGSPRSDSRPGTDAKLSRPGMLAKPLSDPGASPRLARADAKAASPLGTVVEAGAAAAAGAAGAVGIAGAAATAGPAVWAP